MRISRDLKKKLFQWQFVHRRFYMAHSDIAFRTLQ
jgi:hypothetical protein